MFITAAGTAVLKGIHPHEPSPFDRTATPPTPSRPSPSALTRTGSGRVRVTVSCPSADSLTCLTACRVADAGSDGACRNGVRARHAPSGSTVRTMAAGTLLVEELSIPLIMAHHWFAMRYELIQIEGDYMYIPASTGRVAPVTCRPEWPQR